MVHVLTFMRLLDEREDTQLGLEREVISYLPVWGPGVPTDVSKVWSHGVVNKASIVSLNPLVVYKGD